MCVFSFLVAAGFEPMYFSLGSEHLIHYPIVTPSGGALILLYVCVGAGPQQALMDYDEACFVHFTPGVVHNFPKAVGV